MGTRLLPVPLARPAQPRYKIVLTLKIREDKIREEKIR